MHEKIDESALKLFTAQMEVLQCVVMALRSPAGFDEAALVYVLESRLAGRAADDLTALGVAQLLEQLRPAATPQKRPPQLRLIQGGLAGSDS